MLARPEGEIVTQFAKDEVEQAGLVKFDFLGLKTLTVIDIAVKMISAKRTPSSTSQRSRSTTPASTT